MASSSSTVEDSSTSSTLAIAPALVTTESKMSVPTEDPSSTVVVMASSSQTSTPNTPSPPPAMDPGLLAVACSGSWKKLQSFLNGDPHTTSSDGTIRCCCFSWKKRQSFPPTEPRPTSSDGTIRCCCFLWKKREAFPPAEPGPTPGDGTTGSSAIQQPSHDEEDQIGQALLDRVTVEGNTFLHLMATNSIGEDFVEDDRIRRKAVEYLSKQNKIKDTPLHCAARAGKSRMLSFLVNLARGSGANTVKTLLETKNHSGWTVLHEAVRVGNKKMVTLLMKEDPELATIPEDATSPMYLAILLENKIIAETLHKESGGALSYSGPNGQNALHAAVLRSKALTNMLLEWNKDLTIQRDEKGNTPLHYAASMLGQRDRRSIRLLLLKANQDALYQPDHEGSFPIHVAASVNAYNAVGDYIRYSPKCAGLRDGRGRTFLHVAADKKHISTVSNACSYRNNKLSWIMNMQDNDGNTALHLVVKAGSLRVFCSMLANRHVNLNLTNEKGETPRDIARYNIPKDGLFINQNSEAKIHIALKICGATKGICRRDYLEENDVVQARRDEVRQMELVKDATQSLCIGSVLIATVTFGATFAMPGGYRADDHPHGGTPTLAGRYSFDTFTLANALAFTSSAMATISLMSSGSPLLNPRTRIVHLGMAYYLIMISVKCLVAAFAIGIYMMLAPVAHKTAVAVCVLSSLVVLYQNLELIVKHIVLIAPFCIRKGRIYVLLRLFFFIVGNIIVEYWPIIVIFCSTVRNYHNGKVVPAVQPPTPSP